MYLFGPFVAATVAGTDAIHRPSPGSVVTVQEATLRPPFHHLEFDPEELTRARWAAGSTVSVCLPARDEASTVGEIVRSIREDLCERRGIVDEVIVMDDGSTDGTAAVAADAGAQVVTVEDVLRELGPGSGKGNVMWRSLFAARGDVICWVDADIRDFDVNFITGLLGPLLTDPSVGLVKGFYRRPANGLAHGGGRVTELVARPLISKLFPSLSGIVQPLAGATAGRRSVLEAVPFVEGWGVEFALLVDVVERFGLDRVAQVDLGRIEHDSQTLQKLGPQAMAVLTVALRRAGLDPFEDPTSELLRFDVDHAPEVERVPVAERPPMITVPTYRVLFPEELPA
jgi:glucosyl-3-phosphoglycerate synthase